MNRYADRLRWAMESAGLKNQSELARLVGVKQPTINHLLTQEAVRSGFTPKIAAVLGVSAEWLATGEGAPERETRGTSHTPPKIVQAIIEAIGNEQRDMGPLDPACGTGGFLLAAFDAMKAIKEDERGELADRIARELARQGVRRVTAKFVAAAGKSLDPAALGGFDTILADPPYAGDMSRAATRIAREGKGKPGFDSYLQNYWVRRAQALLDPKHGRITIEQNGLIFLVDKGQKTPVLKVVPVVGRVAAGPWLEAAHPYPLDFGDDAFLSDRTRAPGAFALQVVGESMAELYSPGDRIVIDPDRAPAEGDDVVVAQLTRNDPEEAVMLKRLLKLKTGRNGRIEHLTLGARPARGSDGENKRIELDGHGVRIIGPVVDHQTLAAA
jgi:phage repressor protein C with HTH and peptisase S24 domain